MRGAIVLVIRHAGEFGNILRRAGFEVRELPLVETRPVKDLSDLRAAIARIDEFDGVFVTSPAAARVFSEELRSAGRSFAGTVYVLGERSRGILEQAGLRVKYKNSANTAREMLDQFGTDEFASKRFLFVRGTESMRTVPDRLNHVANIEEAIVYDHVDADVDYTAASETARLLDDGKIDWICFFSPSAVEAFLDRFGEYVGEETEVAVIGDTTAASARSHGMTVGFVSKRATARDFAEGFVQYIKLH